jgi:hypothetical protein
MLGDHLYCLIEESVCRFIVSPAICSPTAAAFRRSDNPKLIIWEPLLAPVSDHGVDLTI